MDPARRLFEEFRDHGIERIQQAVDEGEAESLFLDFKQSRSRNGAMDADDRKNLGKNLSGFANASGGVLVWGVESKNFDDRNPLRKAVSLAPIPNIRRFVDDLNSQIGQVVQRPIEGVESQGIDGDASSGTGFAVTYVPPSSARPHMSIAADDKRYYLRSGSQTMVIDHVLVEALMMVQERPRLELVMNASNVETKSAHGTEQIIRAHLALRNIGKTSARFVAVSLVSYMDRVYRGKLDLYNGSIVHLPFEDGVSRHALQFRTPTDVTIFPGITVHGVEVIQPLRQADLQMHAVHWRIDTERSHTTGILRLDAPPTLTL